MSRLSDASYIARQFHHHYERLAPRFNYQTRRSSAVEWGDVPPENRDLMVATVETLVDRGIIAPVRYVRDLEAVVAGARPIVEKFREYWGPRVRGEEPWPDVTEGQRLQLGVGMGKEELVRLLEAYNDLDGTWGDLAGGEQTC